MENGHSGFSKLHLNNGPEPPKLDTEWMKAEADQEIDRKLSILRGTNRYQCCSPDSRQNRLNDVLEFLSLHLFPPAQHNGQASSPHNFISPGPSSSVSNPQQVPDNCLAMLDRPPGQNINCTPAIFQNGQGYSPYNNIAAIPTPSPQYSTLGSNFYAPPQHTEQGPDDCLAMQERPPEQNINCTAAFLQNGQGYSIYNSIAAIPSPQYSTPGSNSSAGSVQGALQSPLVQSPFPSPYLEPVYGSPGSTPSTVKHSPIDDSNVSQTQIVQHELPQRQQELSIKFTSPILSHLNVPTVDSLSEQPKVMANKKTAAKTKNGVPHVPKKRGRRPKSAQVRDNTMPGTSTQPTVILNNAANHDMGAMTSQQLGQTNLIYAPQNIPNDTQHTSVHPTQASQVMHLNQEVQFPSAQVGMPRSQFVNASTAQKAHISPNVDLQEQNGILMIKNSNVHRPAPSQTPICQLQNSTHYSAGNAPIPSGINQSAVQSQHSMPGRPHQLFVQQGTTQKLYYNQIITINQQKMPMHQQEQPVAATQHRQYQQMPMEPQQQFVSQQQHPVQRQQQLPFMLPIYQHQFLGVRPAAQKRRAAVESSGPLIQMPRRTATPAPVQHYANTPQIMMNQQFLEVRPAAQKRRAAVESSGPLPQMPRRTATPAPVQHYASNPQIMINGDTSNNQNTIPLPSFRSFANRYLGRS